MEANAIAELAREGLEKRLGTYGYVNKDICYKPYTEGFEDGYKKGLEAKINTTTISDCPLPDGDREAYIKKLLQSDIDKHNKIAALSRKVYDLQKQSDQLTEAKEIIKNIIRVTWGEGWNYSLDWKVKAEQFLKE